MVSIGTQPTSLRDRFRRMLGSSRERAAARAELAAQSGRAPLPAPGGVEPGLPYLPPKRPRPITPPPPCQDSSASELEVRQSPAGIFTRLPPELRRAVLVAAFGERKIHVDLRRTQPILPWPDPKAAARSQTLHCRGHTPLSSHVYRNREAPFIPRWWSCVCHHDPCLWDRRLETMWPSPGLSCLSRGYQCIRGDAMACKKWETDEENRCCVGVMGWLLSCRQA
jgi:hypothetical protein